MKTKAEYDAENYAKHRESRILQKRNYKRIKKGLEPLSFEELLAIKPIPPVKQKRLTSTRSDFTDEEYSKYRKLRLAQTRAEWTKKNRGMKTACNARYKARKKQAMPGWANKEKIDALYVEARRLTEKTGIKHHVDHIVPLKSDIVCGLHWEGNMQILTAEENIKKHNKIWPDMPEPEMTRAGFLSPAQEIPRSPSFEERTT
jgi:5-methylcytosine-specific restriction endonuclease McrA